jgi:ribonuclease HI
LRSRGLRPIEWDPSAPTQVFTDGACSANGAPSAEGAFAVHIPKGPLGGVEAAGRVAPHPYAFVDESEPLLGFAHNAGTAATPTNNRSEYLAWCWALLLLLRGGVEGPVEIVSDCRLFISTLEEWLPARRARGTEGELKNLDLVTIGARLLDLLRAAAGRAGSRVALTHTRSHQPPPPPAADPRTRELWHGNSRADAIARAQLGRPESFRLGTAGSRALHWQLVGRYAAGPR